MHRYFYGLDAVRFFSAFLVCLFHLGFYAWASDGSSMSHLFAHRASFDALMPFAWFGWIGVQVFFVISGFVIAGSANGASPMAFLRSRALRLLPAAWICASITLTVRLLAGDSFDGMSHAYARSLVLWLKGPWIDGTYWSLAIEIVFYGMVFLLLLTKRFSRLPFLAWAMAIASCAFTVVDAAHTLRVFGNDVAWFNAIAGISEILPLKHGVFFAIGIWVWMLANRILPRSGWAGIALATAFGLVQIWIRGVELRFIEAPLAETQPAIAPMLAWLAALALIIAFSRWSELFTPRSEGARTALRNVGKVTYPLYLVHAMVGTEIMAALIDRGVVPYAAFVLAFVSVLSLGTLVALFGEPVVRRLFAKAIDQVERLLGRLRPLGFLFSRADRIELPGGAKAA
jgi:exopolysaccharide production protein ExoZ